MLNRKRNDNIEDIENEVNQWRSENREKVEINLFPGEEEYLVEKMNCIVLPLLYEIKDKHFENMKDCPNFIKEKHSRKNKRLYKLKKRERELLDSQGIEYQPLGYIVYLWKKEQDYLALFLLTNKLKGSKIIMLLIGKHHKEEQDG